MSALKPEDREALLAELADVAPLGESDKTASAARAEADPETLRLRREGAVTGKQIDPNFLTTTAPRLVAPEAELSWKRDGVQTGVFKSLRQGQYEARYGLDLHRHSVEQARSAVYEFILDAFARQERCVIILHGRGSKAATPALLKSHVNAWLPQFEQVLAFHSAQKRDGGTGAVYVLLRKTPEASEENRELYSRR